MGILDGVVYVEANNSVTVKMNVKRKERKERAGCYIYSTDHPLAISYRTYPKQGWDYADEEEEERKYLETNKQTNKNTLKKKGGTKKATYLTQKERQTSSIS